MSDQISTRLNDHKDDIERLYFTEGLSYQQIADKYGKSREAIRQFLNRHFADRREPIILEDNIEVSKDEFDEHVADREAIQHGDHTDYVDKQGQIYFSTGGKWFRHHIVSAGFQKRLNVNKQQRETMEKLEYERRLRNAEPCIICGDPVTRKTGGRGGKVKTCSPEHSRLWVEARYNLDDEYRDRQRLSTAHTVLKYPEKYNASSVQWAQKVVNDALEAQRRYMIRGSRASDAYERVMQIRQEKFETNGNGSG